MAFQARETTNQYSEDYEVLSYWHPSWIKPKTEQTSFRSGTSQEVVQVPSPWAPPKRRYLPNDQEISSKWSFVTSCLPLLGKLFCYSETETLSVANKNVASWLANLNPSAKKNTSDMCFSAAPGDAFWLEEYLLLLPWHPWEKVEPVGFALVELASVVQALSKWYERATQYLPAG